MWPWTTKPVISSMGQKYIVWAKIIDFSFMPKIIKYRSCSMKIFCKFPTVNISKLNFWLVICIAKNFIWTTLKAIFSIFCPYLDFFGTLRFPIFKLLYISQILSYPNKPYINGKLISFACKGIKTTKQAYVKATWIMLWGKSTADKMLFLPELWKVPTSRCLLYEHRVRTSKARGHICPHSKGVNLKAWVSRQAKRKKLESVLPLIMNTYWGDFGIFQLG